MSENDDQDIDNNKSSLPLTNMTIREYMVNTAVNFLQNPKVLHSPLSQKRAFLLKKGLTEGEIDAAFQRAGNPGSNLVPYNQALVTPEGYVLEQQTPYKPSFWTLVNRYGSAVIIIGVALYGLHQFYKFYIEPWLFGEHRKEDRMIQFEKQLLELNRSLSQLRRSVTSIEEALNVQKEQLNKTISEKNREFHDSIGPSFFIDLKADVATVKSLLLSRHQFPDVPKISPTIPEWQLVNGSSGKVSERLEEQTTTCSDQNKTGDGEQESDNSANLEEDAPEIVEKDKLEAEESIEAAGGQEEPASLSASSDSFEHYSACP